MNKENIQDILDSVCGLTEKNERKAVLSVNLDKWCIKKGEESVTSLSKYLTTKAEIQISSVNEEYILMDFIFPSNTDTDLKMIWRLLNKPIEDLNKTGEYVTLKHIILTPINFEGFYMDAIAPIFMALQPSDIDSPCDSIRVLFKAENVSFYYTDEIDAKQLEDELKAEEQARIDLDNRMAEKRLMHEQYGTTEMKKDTDSSNNPNIIHIK